MSIVIASRSRSVLSKSITSTTITIPSLCSFSTSTLLFSENQFGVDKGIAIHNYHNSYTPYFLTQNIKFSSSQHQQRQTISRMSSDCSNSDNQPAPPFQYYSPSSIHRLDLTELDTSITLSENNRQEAFDTSSKIKVLITKIRRTIEQQQIQSSSPSMVTTIATTSSDSSEQLINLNQELDTIINSTLPSHKQAIRIANLTTQFQEYARIKSFQYFLSTGKLLPPSQLPPNLSDEEYLAGAVIGLTQDLARYVVGRATARDVKSVIIGRDLVEFCLDYLMTFDFRNGMLRRKYDGVKYALKTCETVLYELSVTGLDVEDEEGKDPALKRRKVDGNDDNKDGDNDDLRKELKDELEQLHSSIVHRDELREKLIKRCRDAQKAAKQAIFALHRGDEKRCIHLITDCEKIVNNDLNPMVEEDPSLYHGSYANVLEEYAEAKLFHSWLMGKPKGQLLQPSDFTAVKLEPADYLGGLCDLTGEVGRYAVQRGTKRDSDGVHFCLDTNMSIVFALETLRHFPSGSYIYKKMDQLKQSVEKLERMLYELSLVSATGCQIVSDSIKDELKVKKNDEESND
jgi:predicted translin family RNA/ssDNA-binding protein